MNVGQVYRHSIENSVYAERGLRGLTLITDSKEALIGKISETNADAIWSMNDTFVIMAEDYLRHDIYLIKTMMRFNPVLKEAFGERYQKMTDIYQDQNA
jgi:hypothetical protein